MEQKQIFFPTEVYESKVHKDEVYDIETNYSSLIKQKLENFGRNLILHTNLKAITIKAHLENIGRFFRKANSINPSIEQVENYVLALKQSSYSYNHIMNNVVSIEKYFFFIGQKITFAKLKKPRRLIKDFLSESEVARIISACKNIREKVIISLLAYSGIRNKELCDLKVSDLDFGDNTVRVLKGKNSKERVVNMSGECTKILIKYLSEFPREENDYLFTSLKKNNQYTTSDLRKLVRVVSKRIEINRRVYPHLFRHSLASNLLKRGANILMIKQQLGHDYLESTMIYLHSCPQRTKSEYDFYKPSYI